MTDSIKFRLQQRGISDGSQVFAVNMVQEADDGDFQAQLLLDAISEADAIKLQKKIWDAIKEHTNENVVFIEQ